jgi:hypothetical protein
LEADVRGRECDPFFYVSPLVSLGTDFKISPSFGNFFLDPRLSCPPVFDLGAIEIKGPVSSTVWFAPPVMASDSP